MLARDEQPENTDSSILVMPLGISILVRDEHLANAEEPMLVTPLGIFMLVRDVQP